MSVKRFVIFSVTTLLIQCFSAPIFADCSSDWKNFDKSSFSACMKNCPSSCNKVIDGSGVPKCLSWCQGQFSEKCGYQHVDFSSQGVCVQSCNSARVNNPNYDEREPDTCSCAEFCKARMSLK